MTAMSIDRGDVAADPPRRSWVLVVYRAPKEPSTARVAAWRRLHRLGGLYIGPAVCLIPRGLTEQGALDQVAAGVRSAGGTFDALVVEAFAAEAHMLLAERFNSARNAEYAEVVERAQALQAELGREGGRGKLTFAEVGDNEADLGKLQRWLEALDTRDLFGAPGRGPAERSVREAEDALRRFAERAARLEEETPP
jgi:hypothetical protein